MVYQTIITVEELNNNINATDWFIFDCRFLLKDPAEGGIKLFNKGHIPGAQFADMDTDLASAMTSTSGRHPLPDPHELVKKLQSWGVNNSSQIICYDDKTGAFAARMWWLLKWLGHNNVAVLNGGIHAWTEKNLPLQIDVQKNSMGSFEGEANNEMWVDIEFIKEQLKANKINLFDARSSDRFTAKDLKTDPVPGHIPGAMSLPFAGNVSKQGEFLPTEELQNRYTSIMTNAENKEAISMCGSGVTACHNLLAMSIAGFPMMRLYVGSWSEWIKDKSRPVATGES